jgi:DNA-directed RNA polymerase subunit RPC12/RpoP
VRHTNKKIYRCEICNTTFEDNLIFKTHILTVHEDKKLFVCTTCGRGFNRKAKLEQHMSSVHEGTKFPCLTCHKTYVFKSDLKRHISDRHSGSNELEQNGEFPHEVQVTFSEKGTKTIPTLERKTY